MCSSDLGAGKLVSFLERHALMLRFIDISSARPGALEALVPWRQWFNISSGFSPVLASALALSFCMKLAFSDRDADGTQTVWSDVFTNNSFTIAPRPLHFLSVHRQELPPWQVYR